MLRYAEIIMDKKRWADYSDSDMSSDEETKETTTIPATPEAYEMDDSVERLSLPFYFKIFNFPFIVTEQEIVEFLGIPSSQKTNLRLIYSNGGKKKFRGIVIFKVIDYAIAKSVKEAHCRLFKDRKIGLEVQKEWKPNQSNKDTTKRTAAKRIGKNSTAARKFFYYVKRQT